MNLPVINLQQATFECTFAGLMGPARLYRKKPERSMRISKNSALSANACANEGFLVTGGNRT